MIASRSCCRFVVCTSMMWISRSTTSQRCSTGLRSRECGGHLSKVNSLSCSRNLSEMIWALWHGALSCWKYIRRWVHCSHKGMDMVSNNTQGGCEGKVSRNRDSSDQVTFFQSSIFQFWWVCVNCFLFLGDRSGTRCGLLLLYSPSASGFDVLCVQRWYSAYLGCNEWLFELLLTFYHL